MSLQNDMRYAIMEGTTCWPLGSGDGFWKATLNSSCSDDSLLAAETPT